MINELKSKVEMEAAALRGLFTQFEELQGAIESLRGRQGQVQERALDCVGTLRELAANLPAQKEALREILMELHELPDTCVRTWSEVEAAAEQGLEEAGEATEVACNVLEEQTEKMVEEAARTLGEAFQSWEAFVQEDFVKLIEETCQEELEQMCERGEELRESIGGGLEQLATVTQKQLAELKDELEEVAGHWNTTVDHVDKACGDMVENVTKLGDEVATLTSAVQDALETAGVGMNAAAGTMDDICSVMGGIA